MANLSAIDAIVLAIYLLFSVALGVWLSRGQQDAKRYLLGGNNVPWWAILGSVVATETSTVTFLSVPGIAFAEGGDLRFLQLAIGYIAGRTLIVFWLLPLYFRGKVFTVYQLLQERFGYSTQKLASLIFLITRNLGDGLRLFLTAIVLEATLGWSLPTCVIIIGIATIVFTFFGGMQSVIWNDCIQLAVYIMGGLIAFFLITAKVDGGFGGLIDFAQQTGRLRLFDFEFFDDTGPRLSETYTFWAGLIGGAFLTLGTHGTDQMFVQRALAAQSQSDAGKALVLSGVVVFLQFALFLFVGIALARFYSANPPAAEFASTDRVFCTFIVEELPRGIGLVGLLLAAVFSAAMSTLSSSLNSSATAVVTDWLMPSQREMSDKRIVGTTRWVTILFGVVQIAIGIWAVEFDKSVISNALAIAGFASGLLLGLFAIGTFMRQARQPAAIVGLLFGTFVLLIVKFNLVFGVFVFLYVRFESEFIGTALGWSRDVAWPWFPVIGAIATFFAGALMTLLSGIFSRFLSTPPIEQ